jgi:hypothetical protein
LTVPVADPNAREEPRDPLAPAIETAPASAPFSCFVISLRSGDVNVKVLSPAISRFRSREVSRSVLLHTILKSCRVVIKPMTAESYHLRSCPKSCQRLATGRHHTWRNSPSGKWKTRRFDFCRSYRMIQAPAVATGVSVALSSYRLSNHASSNTSVRTPVTLSCEKRNETPRDHNPRTKKNPNIIGKWLESSNV